MTLNERVVFVQQRLQLFLHWGVEELRFRAALHFFYVGYMCSCYLRVCRAVESRLDVNLKILILQQPKLRRLY